MPEVVQIPGMAFRGLKIYLESRNDKDDEVAIRRFGDWVKHHTGHDLRDDSFYHLEAKQTLEQVLEIT